MKILIVEDEAKLASGLADFLQENGFDVQIEGDGAQALQLLESTNFGAIILDWLLPGVEGIDICRALRDRNNLTPILMLTAQSGLRHRIQGIETGADDYITKPFHLEEVLVRLRGIIRRSQQMPATVYQAQGYSFLVTDKKVRFEQNVIELSQKEADILALLFQHQGETVDRKSFLQHVWGYSFDPNTNVVEVYIKMLRNKLSQIGNQELIKTKRGAGYFIPGES